MIALALGLAAIASSTTPSVKAASVSPDFTSGNPTCADLGYTFELKLDPPSSGNFPIGNGGTLNVVLGGTGELASFSSDVYITAVIMKGGPNANVYDYGTPGVLSDTDLVTPTNPSNDQPYGTSHISFCFNDPDPVQGELTVTKTAELNYDRECTWDVTKEANTTSLVLEGGETAQVNYTVRVTVNCVNGDPAGFGTVSGEITVTNIGGLAVEDIEIVDELDGVEIDVDCGAFDGTLDPDEFVVCTYSESVAIGDGENFVSVSGVDTADNLTEDEDTAEYTDNGPDSVILGCVYLSDTHPEAALSGEELCEENQPVGGWVFNYSVDVTAPEVCAPFTVDNTATIRDEEDNIVDQDSVSIPVTCAPTGEWCSPGYWRNHLDEAAAAAAAGGFSLNDTYASQFGSDPARKNKGVADDAPVSPTLLEVLQNPQWYSDGAFNAVGDLLSAAHPGVEFGGERIPDSCPLN